MARAPDRRNAATVAALLGIVVVMGGLAYASVPLYRWFCQVTGYGGTTQVAAAAPAGLHDRSVTIRFNADVNSKLPWRFQPVERSVKVRLGEEKLAFYRASNLADRPVTGHRDLQRHPGQGRPLFRQARLFLLHRTDPRGRAQRRHAGFVLCRSGNGDGPQSRRRDDDHALLYVLRRARAARDPGPPADRRQLRKR